jgi:hypothetical protein
LSIKEQVQDIMISDCLASYVDNRRAGINHLDAVSKIVKDYAQRPHTLITAQEEGRFMPVSEVRSFTDDVGTFRWSIEYQKWIEKDLLRPKIAYFRVVAHLVNQGTREVTLPARGTMLTIADQESREYSSLANEELPRPRPEQARPNFVFAPSLPQTLRYIFEVPRNFEVKEFRVRQLDDAVNQFDNDAFKTIRVQAITSSR